MDVRAFVAALGMTLGLGSGSRAEAASPAEPAPSRVSRDPKQAAHEAASAEAAALEAKNGAERLAAEAVTLADQHRALASSLAVSRAELGKHWRTAQSAYTLPKTAVPVGKPAPLPKLSALKTAKSEYEAFIHASSAVVKDERTLRASEARLEEHAEAALTSASSAKTAAQQAQDSAAALHKVQAEKPAPPNAKAAAELADAQLKSARGAATTAAALAQKARSKSGFSTAAAYTSKQTAAASDAEKAKAQLALANATLREVDARLSLQNPEVPGCDWHKVPWRDMTYPWLPWGTLKHALQLKDGAWVCDEPDHDNCVGPPNLGDISPGPDSALILGDLDGDGKPEAALQLLTFCCDVSSFEVLIFKQDAQCHLEYVDEISFANSSASFSGGALVADLPFARQGENMGLGAVSGMEHAEWRLLNGKLRKTKSVKSVAPLQ